MSRRVKRLLEGRWLAAGRPETGFVFAGETKSGHIEPSTIRGLHARALAASGVRPFVLYTLRHTFLTRLGESGCDVSGLVQCFLSSQRTVRVRDSVTAN